jgi:hypothetical protein
MHRHHALATRQPPARLADRDLGESQIDSPTAPVARRAILPLLHPFAVPLACPGVPTRDD